MEKCTYCVQRIEGARIDAARRRTEPVHRLRAATACQQACPAEAIVFGNLNDPKSRVKQLHEDAAPLRPAPRARDPAPHRLPGEIEPQPGPGDDPEHTPPRPTRSPGRRPRSSASRRQRPAHRRAARARLGSPATRAGCCPSGWPLAGTGAMLLWPHRHHRPRHRHVGQQPPGRLGLRHHQLRLVDRHRPRRHAHLGHPPALPAEVAHLHQPLRRGHDHLRGHVRGAVPAAAHRAALVRSTGSSPTRTPWASGRTSRARSSGTCSRSRPTSPSRCSSGTSGLIPDFATLRDRHRQSSASVYGIFALGWRGSGAHWHHYQVAYLLLAGLSTPLVVSVHSIVSFDFAVSLLPGWHTTIFPPYFVAGAIFAGFAMVLTLLVPARHFRASRTSSPCATWRTWTR